MKSVFYVECKDESGNWQPLGVMTVKSAVEWSWSNGHRALRMRRVGAAGD